MTIRRLIAALSQASQYDEILQIAHDYRAVVNEQRDLIARKNSEIDQMVLEHARNTRDLLERFLVAIDHPEVDVRESILLGLRDLCDEIARMEEHLLA